MFLLRAVDLGAEGEGQAFIRGLNNGQFCKLQKRLLMVVFMLQSSLLTRTLQQADMSLNSKMLFLCKCWSVCIYKQSNVLQVRRQKKAVKRA